MFAFFCETARHEQNHEQILLAVRNLMRMCVWHVGILTERKAYSGRIALKRLAGYQFTSVLNSNVHSSI